jgi:hypothetical protein
MKKLFVAILAILYMSVSTGATLHLHYCMGKLIGWDLGHKEGDACGSCGMKKGLSQNKGCCKDEHKQIKLDNDQKTVESIVQLMQISGAVILPVYGLLPESRPVSLAVVYPVNNSPPRSSRVDLFLLHRHFRI